MNEQITKALVFNFFSGNATALEKEAIDKWVRDTAGREQFFIWLQEWENSKLQYTADVERGIAMYRNRKNKNEIPPILQEVSYLTSFEKGMYAVSRIYWMTAASILLFTLSGGWFFRDHIRYEIHTTTFGETLRLALSDGSKVILNANSSLRVPRFGFGEKSREVILAGEANFNIKHTPDHKKFIVRTGKNLDIEVLGTEFNVYSRSRGSKIVLNKGKIQLHYQEGGVAKRLIMKPGDLVAMDSKGHTSMKKTENPQDYSAWKAHRFVFDGASLEEICRLFEDNFGVTVQIPDTSLAGQKISGSFTALNAEELLDILADDSGLSYQRSADGKQITLRY